MPPLLHVPLPPGSRGAPTSRHNMHPHPTASMLDHFLPLPGSAKAQQNNRAKATGENRFMTRRYGRGSSPDDNRTALDTKPAHGVNVSGSASSWQCQQLTE